MRLFKTFSVTSLAVMYSGLAFAQSGDSAQGIPTSYGLSFQTPASEFAIRNVGFHDTILIPMMFGISIFVFGLLAYVLWRFRASNNPTPSRFTHNQTLEVLWTAIPVLILVAITIPSTKLLYAYETVPEGTNFTLKATGSQWLWTYTYPDIVNADGEALEFEARLIGRDDPNELTNQAWRLLETDNVVVVPINTNIRLQIASSDVLHAFALPALHLKKDAVPGRLNQLPARFVKEGTYFGQCSEICGKDHAYMPITIQAVSQEKFDVWAANSLAAGEPDNQIVQAIWKEQGQGVKTIDTAALAASN